jgi:1,4-alpha-glucan branching enzyme
MARKTKGAKRKTKSAKKAMGVRRRVKFEVEASDASEVYVAGTFNGWDAHKHRLEMKGGVFTKTVLVPKGRHEYKFIVDNVWCVDPNCPDWTPNDKGSLNSVITVK